MYKVVIISHMIPLLSVLDNHIAADRCYQRYHSLSYYLLHILPWYKSGQELNQLLSHTFNTISFFIFITFITTLVLLLLLVVFLKIFQALVVAQDLSKYRQVKVEKFPWWMEN